ncbi:unnamed protein product [Urochloa humidicola]
MRRDMWSHMPISFTEADLDLACHPHEDAMVITANVAGWVLDDILVDIGSSADILFANSFDLMELDRRLLEPARIPLIGFGGTTVKALGKLSLPVSFGDPSNPRTEQITFDVVTWSKFQRRDQKERKGSC